MTDTNAELARRGYEAAVRGDLDALREFLDPEVKWHGGDPSASSACQNRERALEVIGEAAAVEESANWSMSSKPARRSW